MYNDCIYTGQQHEEDENLDAIDDDMHGYGGHSQQQSQHDDDGGQSGHHSNYSQAYDDDIDDNHNNHKIKTDNDNNMEQVQELFDNTHIGDDMQQNSNSHNINHNINNMQYDHEQNDNMEDIDENEDVDMNHNKDIKQQQLFDEDVDDIESLNDEEMDALHDKQQDTTLGGDNQEQHMDVEQERNQIGIADSWIVIGQYFKEKGLVRQQIESYNEFINNTIQEIVDDTRTIVALSEPEMDNDGVEKRTKCEIQFRQVYITPPVKIEGMNQEEPLIPHSCRLRHLTYCAEAQVLFPSYSVFSETLYTLIFF